MFCVRVPYFLVAIVLTVVNLWFQKHGVEIAVRDVSFTAASFGAPAVVWFYLGPRRWRRFDLIFSYPQWEITTGAWIWWMPLVSAVIITVLLARKYNSPQPIGVAIAVVRLAVFRHFAGAGARLIRRRLHAVFARGRSLPTHRAHRRRGSDCGAAWSDWYWHSREAGRILATICAAGSCGIACVSSFSAMPTLRGAHHFV